MPKGTNAGRVAYILPIRAPAEPRWRFRVSLLRPRSAPMALLRLASPAVRSALLLLAVVLAAAPAHAQYFGRNKVRYDDFRFRILETEHFDLYYYDGMEQAARDVGRMAERWYDRLSGVLGHEFDERKTIILYADDADFRQTNIADIGEGTQGVTEGLRQRVVLPMASTYAETDHVLGHELVHQFQYDIARRSERFNQFIRLPLFLIEGMAEYFSVGREDALTAMWMRDAVLRDDVPSLTDLQRSARYNEYRYGQPFWAFLAGTYGDEAGVRFFRTALEMPLDSALVAVTGLAPDAFSERWAAALRTQLAPAAEGREVPQAPRTPDELRRIAEERESREAARTEGRRPRPPRFLAYPDSLATHDATRLLARERDTGTINLAPQLSPDGRAVAYFSERNLFGLDLFLADAVTGEVLATLQSVGTDPHLDALRFIESAGSWSPDGQQFAFVVFSGGDNEIAVLDVDRRRTARRLAVEGVGAIKDPSWSPDGGRIAFSGVRGGITDLYVIDVASGEVTQLTNDRFSDLQPVWRPDGGAIAFVTDRGPGTDFDRLVFSEPRLAVMDLATRTIEPLSLFTGAKHINPAWSPDGRSLYFISDRGGINDVYRRDMTTGALYRVTNLATGVAGIAALSPALSVASGTGSLAYSVFEGQRYSVYRTDAADAVGEPVDAGAAARADVLPPAEATASSRVSAYLADARSGLPPADTTFASRDLRRRLRLDYVSQPQIGGGYDPYQPGGVGVAGGVSFLFSDQLSDQVLGVTVQANGSIQDIGAQALYLNRTRRLFYGAQVGHVPYLQGFIACSPGSVGVCGDAADEYVTRYYYRTFVTQGAGLVAYPFNQNQRVELQGGYTRYGFDLEYDRAVRDPDSGALFYDGRANVPGFEQDAMHLAQAGTAFVGDHSVFGFTSPIDGMRYRFGAEGTLGTLTFGAVTADARFYELVRPSFLPRRVPLTFAARAFHYGRYGGDASDGRLYPLYLGYGQFVRGYSFNSFESNAEFDAFADRLYGSRLALATAEMRLPLLGVSQLGLLTFPFLPTELVVFADGGIAWGPVDQRTSIDLETGETTTVPVGRTLGEQKPVFSAGVSARVNVLGALIVEPYVAFPFSRYDDVAGLSRGRAIFGFNLTPGW